MTDSIVRAGDYFIFKLKIMLYMEILCILAGHPLRGWPARLRGHKGPGLWKVWTVPSPHAANVARKNRLVLMSWAG